MTFGPIGNTAGLSGAQNDTASQLRRAQADQKAQKAEGLGATDGDAETSDRDADGRRMWEVAQKAGEDETAAEDTGHAKSTKQSKDVSGKSGGLLDLTG